MLICDLYWCCCSSPYLLWTHFLYAQPLTLPIPVMCLINGKLNKRFCVFVVFQENQSVEGETEQFTSLNT